MNELGLCICGAELKPYELCCSDRCRWISEKLKSPLAQRMDNTERAVRFFGKLYDKRAIR